MTALLLLVVSVKSFAGGFLFSQWIERRHQRRIEAAKHWTRQRRYYDGPVNA